MGNLKFQNIILFHPSTFRVRLCCLLFPCFSVSPPFIFICFLSSNVSLKTSNDYFVIVDCARQTKNVLARKSCALWRLWRSSPLPHWTISYFTYRIYIVFLIYYHLIHNTKASLSIETKRHIRCYLFYILYIIYSALYEKVSLEQSILRLGTYPSIPKGQRVIFQLH